LAEESAATTKSKPTTREVLTLFNLIEHFEHVPGDGRLSGQPAPDVILNRSKFLGAESGGLPAGSDSPRTWKPAAPQASRSAAVRYGYGDPASWRGGSPTIGSPIRATLCRLLSVQVGQVSGTSLNGFAGPRQPRNSFSWLRWLLCEFIVRAVADVSRKPMCSFSPSNRPIADWS